MAAARVAARGLPCFAITLAMWARSAEEQRDRGCCSVDAVEDARRVAAALRIPHYVWNLEAEFEARVVEPACGEYAEGLTPNPCTRCNERIKFGVLLARALAAGATHLVTGHYARRGRRGADATLHRARDSRRDQSYVLHRVGAEQLACAIFPLGDARSKAEVRNEAAALGLATAAKPESQDLCFAGGDLRSELSRRLQGRYRPGPLLDSAGGVAGAHDGLPFYTVGQRSGLRLRPGRPDQPPLYVIEVRPEDNALVVGERRRLERDRLEASDCRWIGAPPAPGTRCQAQLRAHGVPHDAEVLDAGHDVLRLRFEAPVMQVSPGQAVVLYSGDEVLGGGVVRRAA